MGKLDVLLCKCSPTPLLYFWTDSQKLVGKQMYCTLAKTWLKAEMAGALKMLFNELLHANYIVLSFLYSHPIHKASLSETPALIACFRANTLPDSWFMHQRLLLLQPAELNRWNGRKGGELDEQLLLSVLTDRFPLLASSKTIQYSAVLLNCFWSFLSCMHRRGQ